MRSIQFKENLFNSLNWIFVWRWNHLGRLILKNPKSSIKSVYFKKIEIECKNWVHLFVHWSKPLVGVIFRLENRSVSCCWFVLDFSNRRMFLKQTFLPYRFAFLVEMLFLNVFNTRGITTKARRQVQTWQSYCMLMDSNLGISFVTKQ